MQDPRSHEALLKTDARVAGWLAFALPATVYGMTMARGLVWGDGLELAAVCKSLGVAHPTGYPLFTVLGHASTYLPTDSPAQSVTFLCMLVMAASCRVLYQLLWVLSRAEAESVGRALPWWVLAGTLTFAWASAPWSHGTRIEVYGLQLLFQLAVSCIFLEQVRSPSEWRRAGLVFVWGLGVGHHLLALVLAPLVFAAFWVAAPGEGQILGRPGACRRFFRRLLLPLLSGSLGLLPMVYVPLRAMMSPALNFGDPSTWRRWYWTLSGGDYLDRFLYGAQTHVVGSGDSFLQHFIDRVLSLGRFLAQQIVPGSTEWFGWGVILATGLGLAVLGLRQAACEWSRFGFVKAWLAMGGFYVFVLTVYDISDIADYQLGFLGWIWPMGWLGFLALARGGQAAEPARLGFVFLIPMLLLVANWKMSDRSAPGPADRYAERLFEGLPQESLLITEGDVATGTAWYLQHGLERRADVRIVSLNLIPRDWYARQLLQQGIWDGPLPSARGEGSADRISLLWEAVLAPKIGKIPISLVVTQSTSNVLRRHAVLKDERPLLTSDEIVEIMSAEIGPPLHGRVESIVPDPAVSQKKLPVNTERVPGS